MLAKKSTRMNYFDSLMNEYSDDGLMKLVEL